MLLFGSQIVQCQIIFVCGCHSVHTHINIFDSFLQHIYGRKSYIRGPQPCWACEHFLGILRKSSGHYYKMVAMGGETNHKMAAVWAEANLKILGCCKKGVFLLCRQLFLNGYSLLNQRWCFIMSSEAPSILQWGGGHPRLAFWFGEQESGCQERGQWTLWCPKTPLLMFTTLCTPYSSLNESLT